jgi:hypothetical protein
MIVLFLELLGIIGSVASIAGLAAFIRPTGYVLTARDGGLIGLAAVLIVLACYVRVNEYVERRPIILKSKKAIRDYMYAWISQSGRVVIFTRDLTWVEDAEMQDMLRIKAKKSELSVCLPKKVALSEELRELGASIYTYPELDLTPTSRFTIINLGSHDARVAIGHRRKGRHYIHEASAGEDPLFAIANDLVGTMMHLDRLRPIGR